MIVEGSKVGMASDNKETGDSSLEKKVENLDLKHVDSVENLKDDAVDVGALVPVPPDGGYGWVIVFAAFLCNFLVDGIANAFGQFTKLYVETFQSDTATVAFVGSCLIGAYLLVGPVVSALTNKFGARIVVIVGSIISGIAFLLSILSPNIYVMIGLYGVVGGIGFGFVYLPAICVVCYYFEKKRSLATGIAVAGSGAGTIVMPPLCFELLKNFGYKITLAVLAGFAFTGIGMGILYRPLMAPGSDENKDVDKEMKPMGNGNSNNASKQENIENNAQSGNASENKGTFRTRSAVSECDDPSMRPLIDGERSRHDRRNRTVTSESDATPNDHRSSKTRLSQGAIKGAESLASVASSIDPKEFSKPMNRSDIFYQGSIQNLPEFQKEGRDFRKYRESQVSIPAEVAAQAAGQPETKTKKGLCSCFPSFQMLDFELLKNSAMILLSFSNLFGMLGFYVPFMFVFEMAKTKGIPEEQAKWLLPVIGVFNTLGRIAFGWLADRKWLSALALNNISLLSCGVLTLICPYLSSYTSLMIYSILFGFIISAYICLTSIVLTDLLGLDRLTNAFGILVVSRSIACFIGTPVAGFVYEKTNSYTASFCFAGVLILLGGFATVIISIQHYLAERRAKKTSYLDDGRTEDTQSLQPNRNGNKSLLKR